MHEPDPRSVQLGQAMRAVRRHLGLAQRTVAKSMGCTRQHLSAFETGRDLPIPDTWHRWLAAVGASRPASAEDLRYRELIERAQQHYEQAQYQRPVPSPAMIDTGHHTPQRRVTATGSTHPAATNGTWRTDGPGTSEVREQRTDGSDVIEVSPTVGSPRTEGGDGMRRRDLVGLAALGLTSIVAPPLVHGWGEPRAESPELTEALLSQVRAQTEGWRWLDRREGAAKHLPATAASARTLTEYWQQVERSHPLRAPLAEVAADACHLVAYQCYDQGRRVQAAEWYRSAAELAAQATSLDLYAFAICGVAYMHARDQHADLAFSVLGQLGELPLSAAARCHLACYQAHAHAAAGQLDAALRRLDHAEEWAGRVPDEDISPWLGIPDHTFVARQRAMILAARGTDAALEMLDGLQTNTSRVFQRYRVTMAVDRAKVYARTRQFDQAAATLKEALVLNQQTRSVEKARQSLAVHQLLDPQSRSAQELRELVHTTRAGEIAAAHPAG